VHFVQLSATTMKPRDTAMMIMNRFEIEELPES
jgi:hypothetical protein